MFYATSKMMIKTFRKCFPFVAKKNNNKDLNQIFETQFPPNGYEDLAKTI